MNAAAGIEVSLDRLVALAAEAGRSEDTGRVRDRTGGLAGRRRGDDGTDLHDLRAFVDGDDPRRIDAAATARSGRLQVRRVHEDAERVAMLVADFRRPMLWGTRRRLRSVAAAEALALEGWRTVGAGGRVGLVAARDGETAVLAPRPRTGAMLSVAGALARTHAAALDHAMTTPAAPPEPLDTLLDRAAGQVRRGASIVLATGFDAPGDDFEAVAGAVMRRCRLVVLLVQDAVDTQPPETAVPVRLGPAVRHARFGASRSAARLEALGIETRAVHAAA
ncbi:MAG: DUF58 domain-containing protein [Pseudomonadota bacterium]